MAGEPNTYSDGDVDEIIADLSKRIAELEAAALECHSQLSGMSMGTEGYTRNLICRASNVLAKVLGKTPSSHGSDEYFENYRRSQ
jgi:hypothetical protein